MTEKLQFIALQTLKYIDVNSYFHSDDSLMTNYYISKNQNKIKYQLSNAPYSVFVVDIVWYTLLAALFAFENVLSDDMAEEIYFISDFRLSLLLNNRSPLSYLSSIQRGYQPWDYVTYVHQTIIQRHITITIFLYGQIHQGNWYNFSVCVCVCVCVWGGGGGGT